MADSGAVSEMSSVASEDHNCITRWDSSTVPEEREPDEEKPCTSMALGEFSMTLGTEKQGGWLPSGGHSQRSSASSRRFSQELKDVPLSRRFPSQERQSVQGEELGLCSALLARAGGIQRTSAQGRGSHGISRKTLGGFNDVFSQVTVLLSRLADKHEQEVAKLERDSNVLRTRISRISRKSLRTSGGSQKIEDEDAMETCSASSESGFSVEVSDLDVPTEREPVQVLAPPQDVSPKVLPRNLDRRSDRRYDSHARQPEHSWAVSSVGFVEEVERDWVERGSHRSERSDVAFSLDRASTVTTGVQNNYQMKKHWSERPELWRIALSDELVQNAMVFKQASVPYSSSISALNRASRNSGEIDVHELKSMLLEMNSAERFMINPYKKARSFWLMLAALCWVSDVFILPFDLCFDHDASFFRTWQLVYLIFWTLDIPLTFITGFVKYGQLEMQLGLIARNYTRSWLIFDLFLVGPEWVIIAMSKASISSSMIMRVARFLRLGRIAKLQPEIRRSAVYTYVCNSRVGPFKDIIKATVVLLFGIHTLACFWYVLGDVPGDGWVYRNDLESATVSLRYVVSLNWTCRRLHGMSSEMLLGDSREFLLDAVIIFVGLIVVSAYIGLTAAILNARTKSIRHSLKPLGREFVRRYRVQSSVQAKLENFLRSRRMEVSATSANEKRFLQELPSELREDLMYEARVPVVRVKTIFNDMSVTNMRALRRVCAHAVSAVTAVHGEVIFDTGDACSRMLFTQTGSVRYSCQDREDDYGKRIAFCEAVLWTDWEHRGRLEATEESMLLALDTADFGEVMTQYRTAHIHAVKYARRFTWHLNNLVCMAHETPVMESLPVTFTADQMCHVPSMHHSEEGDLSSRPIINDLLDFSDMSIWNLDQEVYDGDPNDHFVFISHYKVEAGTEATLIRDLFEQVFRQDPLHPAHNLMSPVFVDSEDLDDLASLQDHVKRSSNLLVLLTPGLLSRPWCLLEIVIATRSGVDIIPVEIQRPGFRYQFPNEEFYIRLLNGQFLENSSMDLLNSQGIHLREIEQAIRHVFNKIAVNFSPHKTKQVRDAELQAILRRCTRTGSRIQCSTYTSFRTTTGAEPG